jgi:hypothetical protein
VVAVKATDHGGEDGIKAWLALNAGQRLAPRALLDYCQDRMPRFAIPCFVEYVEALPETPQAAERGVGSPRSRRSLGSSERALPGAALSDRLERWTAPEAACLEREPHTSETTGA